MMAALAVALGAVVLLVLVSPLVVLTYLEWYSRNPPKAETEAIQE